MEKQSTKTSAEQGNLYGQSLCQFAAKIAVNQNRHQNGGAKHGKHVLNTKKQHLRKP